MKPFHKAFAVFAVATLGLWGCAEGPASRHAQQERAKALEVRNAKLEEDYRAAAAAREQTKKKVAALESERAQLQQELDLLRVAVKERDDLRLEVKAKTGERDALHQQFEQFRKGIRELLGQMDNAALPAPIKQPLTSAVILPAGGKS